MNNKRTTFVERENDTFRPGYASKAEQRYADNAGERHAGDTEQREPRRSTENWETEDRKIARV